MTNERIIPITCSSSHTIEISQMRPIQGNLKSRTREQLLKLRSLILKYGFSFPIYLWYDGVDYYTLDGHGRDYICKGLIEDGFKFKHKNGEVNESLPAVLIDAKNRVEAKEKLLAVNSSFGKITEEGLSAFLFEENLELNLAEMKELLELPEVDLIEIEQKLLQDVEEESEKEYKFIFSQQQIKDSIKENFPEYKSTQEIIDGIIDYPLAMHQFNKLCSGNKNVGSDISLLFNPHRLDVKVNNRKYSVSESFQIKEKGFLSSISQWMSKQKEVVHHNQYINTARFNTGTQIAAEFKPFLAREIYLDYCEVGAKVLDPCAGWGGRMLGYISSGIGGEYTATDPSVKTYDGLNKLRDFLTSAEAIESPIINLFNLPFEDLELQENYFDFAFTSPPYFDTELYSEDKTQAFNRYETIEKFNEQFLKVLIQNSIRALKPGKILLLNIGGSQFRFDKAVYSICEELNFHVKEVFKYKIGKGDHIANKYHGLQTDNSIKANDLFFEIKEK